MPIQERIDQELMRFVNIFEPRFLSLPIEEGCFNSLSYEMLPLTFLPQSIFSSHYVYIGELMSDIKSIDDILYNLYPSESAKYQLHRICQMIKLQLFLQCDQDLTKHDQGTIEVFSNEMSMYSFEQIWQSVRTLLSILHQPNHEHRIPTNKEFCAVIFSIQEEEHLRRRFHPIDKEASQKRILQLEKVLAELDSIFSKQY